MRIYTYLFFVVLGLCTISCSYSSKNRKWFDCNTTIDTTEIIEDWTRGSYLINDSLVLSTGCHPFDTSFCSTIKLRIEPIVSYHGKHICGLRDLYPPFKIYKPNVSDTLTVIKDGKVIFFQIPAYICEEDLE